jgi:hypothetical protein
MAKRWFDAETGHLLFDEYVADSPTYKAITRNKNLTEKEHQQKADHLIGLLRRLQSELRPEMQELAGEAFCELAVLHALHGKFQETAWHH